MKFKLFAVSLSITTFLTCTIAFNLLSYTGAVQAGNYGYINKTGKLVIKPQFTEIRSFSQGLAAVKIGDNWGYIDKTGKQLVKPHFSEVRGFLQGLAAVKLDDKWGYIDKTGKMVITPQFSEADSFSEGLAAVQIDYIWGYVDKRGIVVRPLSGSGYSFMVDGSPHGGETIVVRPDSEYSSMELDSSPDSGREITSSYIYNFSEGLSAVETHDGDGTCGAVLCVYGYVDKTGKMVIEPKFFEAREFSEGLAVVLTNDTKSEVITHCIQKGFIQSSKPLDLATNDS